MKFRTERNSKPRAILDMTPLVDVVLLLLLFFMLTSTFVVHTSIPIEMPQVSAADEKPVFEDKDISITLAKGEGGPDGKGPIYLDQEPVDSMAQLSEQLIKRYAQNSDVSLLILADQETSSGRLVEVLDIASRVGIHRYNIATQASGPVK
ncbi:MAG: biopolymer transporter ExbD [Candidatus Hydrogenedentes bacterium]|nr:biopolymer transporter ExbD [Candidatus Hydrogenedentota bacterium]